MSTDRLTVFVSVGEYEIEAYLTDEGLVVDVWEDDECIASGYEFFSEANLEPPKELEETES